MGRKALRGGVIFIGAIALVFATVCLVGAGVLTNYLTRVSLRLEMNKSEQPAPPPSSPRPVHAFRRTTTSTSTTTSAPRTSGLRPISELTPEEQLVRSEGNDPIGQGTNLNESLKGRRQAQVCGGPELEYLMRTIAQITAREAADERAALLLGLSEYAGQRAMWIGLLLGLLLLVACLEVVHISVSFLLIVGAVKGRPGLLRPWRYFTLGYTAVGFGMLVFSLGMSTAVSRMNADQATNNGVHSSTIFVPIIWLGIYLLCYWAVLTYERQLRKEKEERKQNADEVIERQQSKIYSCRF